jgi:glycolate oxidase
MERQAFLDSLDSVVGTQYCHTRPYARALYRRDASFFNAEPLAVVAPASVEELIAVVELCREHQVPFAPRGAGTGIAGGAVPVGPVQPPLVVSLARMDRILEIDPVQRIAWVESGVVNTELSVAAAPYGLRYAPDPSSQVACTLGGNVATNAGGAHCLAFGVTSNHVVALELVDAIGEQHLLGSLAPEHNGYDLRGVTVGSEGTFGFVTKVCLRLMPIPPVVTTLLFGFGSVRAAAQTVSDLIASGCLPAALELMDRPAVMLVEEYCHAGYPTDAEAVLLAEFEGLAGEVAASVAETRRTAERHDASFARAADTADERAALWRGRKGIAGAMAKAAPAYYLHDVVVPRSKLADVMDDVIDIVGQKQLSIVNVHHAGDGNLHPLVLFDPGENGVFDRVLAAGEGIVNAALAAGGVLSGEHGIGIEKRDFLCTAMTEADLDVQERIRRAMEPTGLANPHKVLPAPGSCGDAPPSLIPEGAWL